MEKIETEGYKKLEKKLKYWKIKEEINELENSISNLEESKQLKKLRKVKDGILKKIDKMIEENNQKLDRKLKEARKEGKIFWEKKLENLKVGHNKLTDEGLLNIDEERKEFIRKYDDFIVELKEEWFRALFYHVFDEVNKNDDKKKLIIKLSKEIIEEEKNEKGEASTSYNIETNQDEKEEHVLYSDKNSVIRKTFLLKIYGKENAVKLVKEKKDSAIFVNMNDKITFGVNEGKFLKTTT
ncbi:unnamed protein product [Meloidogyne enterolobii]|uniref:Uncharacterized protein n=1 Tax=Meloidogyne enterolobii TaxID=390850 RepID=A0ACB1AGE9_MELEN